MGFSKVFQDLVDRKERAEKGEYNCLPLPFPRFRKYFPGIERGKYLIITANQKVKFLLNLNICDFYFVI